MNTTTQRPAISIIVIAYNASRYLGRCLDSIISQSFKDFEVQIINDGSADSTQQIAENYAKKDRRFHLFTQTNQGVAAARQKGLELAEGEFTIHIDADDWVESDMLEELYNAAVSQTSDMIICDYFEHKRGGVEYHCQRPDPMDHLSIMGQFMVVLHGCLWNKLIRRSAIDKYGIDFIPHVNFAEDQCFVLRLLAHEIKVGYTDKALYHWDRTQNNLSLCNKGINVRDRLFPLEMISSYTDISPVRKYYDKAVFLIAYQYLFEPETYCQNYPATFRPYVESIRKAKGFPFYSKLLVLMKIHRINWPVTIFKHLRGNSILQRR